MKIQGTQHIDIFSENIEDIESGKKTGGVHIVIEGDISITSKNDYHQVKLWLSREECKALRKLIREKE